MLTTSGSLQWCMLGKVLTNNDKVLHNFKEIWMKGIPFKLSFFLWRLWKKRLPTGEIFINNRICDNVIFCCFEDNSQEIIEHLFMECKFLKDLQEYFAAIVGVNGPFFTTPNSVIKRWNTAIIPKLKTIYKVVPIIILWQIWKKRNCTGGKKSYFNMKRVITTNLEYLARFWFPWLQNIPDSWVDLVRSLFAYMLRIECTEAN